MLLGNPSVAAVREGGTSLRWMHTRSAGADQYMPEGVLPAGAVLSSSVGAYGISVSEHMFAMLMALMKRLPDYRDNQNAEIWKRTGTAKTLRGAKVLIGGAGVHRFQLCAALQGLWRRNPGHPPECEQACPGH